MYAYSQDGIEAKGIKSEENTFTILKGSHAIIDYKLESGFPDSLISKREELINNKILTIKGRQYQFMSDVKFQNAMEATSIITGDYTCEFVGVWDSVEST